MQKEEARMSVKAFEFVPVIETLQLMGEKAQTRIECIECCGKELYVGTSDSFIVLYTLEEKQTSSGKVIYNSKKRQHRYLELRKPVKTIKAASALKRILVQCDSNLLILNMSDEMDVIGGGPKLKGINTFCVNENPNVTNPFSIQICVAKRKHLQIFNVTDEKLIPVKDISIVEPAVAVAADGCYICAALTTQYVVYNFESNNMQELFTYGSENFLPVIRRITKEEFLLSAPGGLGMFVTSAGESERPPMQWSYHILSIAYFHPYILGLSDEVIVIYSILDQQQKQALPFSGGLNIGNFDGRIYVCSGTAVYGLIPVPWEKQVQVLLSDGRVDEALGLAENANRAGLSKEQFQRIYRKIQQQAAFIHFSNGHFDEAEEQFRNGLVDVREIISLLPQLLPSSSTFVRAVPPLHNIADVVQLFRGDDLRIKMAKDFLMAYLEKLRAMGDMQYRYEVDTALLKLYSERYVSELEAFIGAGEINCDMNDCAEWLEKCECYHALALLYRHGKNHEKALQIWSKLVSGEYKDENFLGLEFFVECLSNLDDYDLVWRYADFVLEKDADIGVRIFTCRSSSESPSDKMKPDNIVEYLHRYPSAVIKYLEHLVLERKIQKEKFHTHLAVLYLENVLKLNKEQNEEVVITARKTLQNLLLQSNLYRVQLLLGKTTSAELHQETAILYGKIEEHDKALNILVHKLKDYKAAEEYCLNNSQGKDQKYKSNLFYTLLNVYLDSKLEPERREQLVVPALELLNTRAADFDAVKVLEVLPQSWSLSVLGSFLRGALRSSLHKYRMSRVESSLARGENLQKQFTLYDLQRHSIALQEINYCCVCKKPFQDGTFARYPNNVVTHIACARHNNICPLTGKVFKTLNAPKAER